MAHDHDIPDQDSGNWRLFFTTGLNFLITIFEIVGGVLSGSLSVISDALHNASDTLALAISYVAIRLSRHPRSSDYTFGQKRAEIIAALFNSSILIAISIWLLREAVGRFSEPTSISGGMMAWVGAVALIANVAGTLLLRKGSGASMNLRAVYLHLIGDAVTSFGVVLGGIAVMLFNITWIDPVITIVISLWIMKESWEIVRDATGVIMMKAPKGIELEEVKRTLEEHEGVENLHHIHIWRLDDSSIFFEAHVDVPDMPLSRTIPLHEELEKILREKFGIAYVTLQFEAGREDSKSLV
jgi:cobalt-zinc-cadmium efflux system protein